MKERERREMVSLTMAITLMEIAFDDLAATFGRTDRTAAEAALVMIEKDIASRLAALRNEYITGAGADVILKKIAARMRDTIRDARQNVADAAKPH